MKFSEMTYTRPDIDAILAQCRQFAQRAAQAASGEELVQLYYDQSAALADYTTAANLANIHYTCDTRDPYWEGEQNFFDSNGPAVTNATVEIYRAILANPHLDALTEALGSTCVPGMKNAVLAMDDRVLALQQEANALSSAYQKLYGGALVELDGKQLTIPQLGPYRQSLDPAVRRAAYEAEAGYFDAHRAEFDELYSRTVKNLNEQARILGYKDYSELSYVRMNRIGYGPEEVRAFREQVARDVVPLLAEVVARRARRAGIQHPTFADLNVAFPDGNPVPVKGYQVRMDAARRMYHELSSETAEFIDFMQDNELFDVLSRPGKANGGYMTMNMVLQYPDVFAAAYPICEAYKDSGITDKQLEGIRNLPIWFTYAQNDTVVPPADYEAPTIERLRAINPNLRTSVFADVHDTSGLYTNEDGTPYQYQGHWSWFYFFNNECVDDTTGENLWAWLGKQHK